MRTNTQRGGNANEHAAQIIAARIKLFSLASFMPLVGTADPATPDPAAEIDSDPAVTMKQSELNALIGDRLKRSATAKESAQARALEDAVVKARAEGEERAKMDAAERAKAELKDERKTFALERETVALEKLEAQKLRRIAALENHVSNTDAALKLLEDAHINDDGSVKVEDFLKAFPFLRKTASADVTDSSNPGSKIEKPDFSKMSGEEFGKYQKRVLAGEKITI